MTFTPSTAKKFLAEYNECGRCDMGFACKSHKKWDIIDAKEAIAKAAPAKTSVQRYKVCQSCGDTIRISQPECIGDSYHR